MSPKKHKRWFIAGLILALAVIGMALFSLNQNSVYFLTPKEAQDKASELTSQPVRIGGMVKVGSLQWEPKELDVRFLLTDLAEVEIPVHYKGAPPDMFKEGGGVVVEGIFVDNAQSFRARNLFVKHSEEYKVPKDKHYLDEDELKRSIINTQ